MRVLNTHAKRILLITMLMIAAAIVCGNARTIFSVSEEVGYVTDWARGLIYIGLFACWGTSLRLRIIQVQVREYMTGISALMVFWMMVRSLKYLFFNGTDIGRYCWYLYYLPMLFIPLLSVFVALSLGRPENFRLPKWGNYLFLLSAGLLLLILTNDFHQLAFAFSKGLQHYENNEYTRGIVYCIAVLWIAVCIITSYGFMIVKTRVPGSRKRVWLPSLLLMGLVTYCVLYATIPESICRYLGDITVVSCFSTVTIFESCIYCGLIQSNTHYWELFHGSSISAVIVDSDYNSQYTSATKLHVSKQQMKEADLNPVELEEGTILHSMPLTNGHIIWLEDVSELRRLQQNLESNAAVLSEEAELLAEEIRQKEEKAVTDVRNRLYDTVAAEIAPQITEINQLIAKRSMDTETRRKTLKKMCVLGAYVKRRCNLIFLNEQQQTISSMELYNCLRESEEYIQQYGIPCSVETISQSNISIENAKLAYDYFEAMVEHSLDKLTAMTAHVIATTDALTIKFMAEGAAVDLQNPDLNRRIAECGGQTEINYEDGVWYCTLILPEGGVM